MVARIETASHPGCTFRRLLRNKDQSKPHALTSYKRYTLTAPKHKKNNDFRLIIGRLSQKGKNNLKLLFARRLCLTTPTFPMWCSASVVAAHSATRLGNLDVFDIARITRFWPALLVFLGVWLLMKRRGRAEWMLGPSLRVL